MSVENLRVDDPTGKGWANLYMNNLTVYNGLTVRGRTVINGDLEVDGAINYTGDRGIASRDVENGPIVTRDLRGSDLHPILLNRGILKSVDGGLGSNILEISPLNSNDIANGSITPNKIQPGGMNTTLKTNAAGVVTWVDDSEIFIGGVTDAVKNSFNAATGGNVVLAFDNAVTPRGIKRGGSNNPTTGAYTVGRSGVYSVKVIVTDDFNTGVVNDTKRDSALELLINGTFVHRAYNSYYGNDEFTNYLIVDTILNQGEVVTFRYLAAVGMRRMVDATLSIIRVGNN